VGYYRGDGGNYYRGDYYKGDPFLGALIGGVARKVVPRLARGALNLLRRTGAKTVGGGLARVAGGVATAGTVISTGRDIARGLRPENEITFSPENMLPGGSPMFGVRRKYRKMNPLNPRALKRALRRAEGFEKFAKKTVNALYKTVDGRRVRTYKKATRAS